MERVAGIEPASLAWKAKVLPLNYTRMNATQICIRKSPGYIFPHRINMVVGAGFEPAKLSRQIYSLIPLATREPHQMLRHCMTKLANVKTVRSISLTRR